MSGRGFKRPLGLSLSVQKIQKKSQNEGLLKKIKKLK